MEPSRENRFPSFFEDAPLLDYLSVCDIRVAPPFAASWKGLTTLRLVECYATAEELINLLCFTGNLVNLSLHSITPPSSHMSNPVMVIVPAVIKDALLPHLEQLEVNFGWPARWGLEPPTDKKVLRKVIQHIHCPQISGVRVLAPTSRDNDLEAVQTCILGSHNPASIRTIAFENLEDECIAPSLVTLLSKLPSLESISIEVDEGYHKDYNSVLSALLWPEKVNVSSGSPKGVENKGAGICPKLSHIELKRLRMDNSQLLHDLVLGRVTNSALRHVIVDSLEFTDELPSSGNHITWLMEMDDILKTIEIYGPSEAVIDDSSPPSE